MIIFLLTLLIGVFFHKLGQIYAAKPVWKVVNSYQQVMSRSIGWGWFFFSFNQFKQITKTFPLFKLVLSGYNKMEMFSYRKNNIEPLLSIKFLDTQHLFSSAILTHGKRLTYRLLKCSLIKYWTLKSLDDI